MLDTLIYVYALTLEKPQLQVFKNIRPEVKVLEAENWSTVVSLVPYEEFSQEAWEKQIQNLDWLQRQAFKHQKVIQNLLKQGTVLPFRLGLVFENEENLRRKMDRNRAFFLDSLRHIHNREEWEIKIFLDETIWKNTHQNQPSKIQQALTKALHGKKQGKAFWLKKMKVKEDCQQQTQVLNQVCQNLLDVLANLSEETKVVSPKTASFHQRSERMIFRAFFLVEKNKRDNFLETFEEIRSNNAQQGLLIILSGAWAAYHFVEQKT